MRVDARNVGPMLTAINAAQHACRQFQHYMRTGCERARERARRRAELSAGHLERAKALEPVARRSSLAAAWADYANAEHRRLVAARLVITWERLRGDPRAVRDPVLLGVLREYRRYGRG